MPECRVPTCSNPLGLNNKSGVCNEHKHHRTFCQCKMCASYRAGNPGNKIKIVPSFKVTGENKVGPLTVIADTEAEAVSMFKAMGGHYAV